MEGANFAPSACISPKAIMQNNTEAPSTLLSFEEINGCISPFAGVLLITLSFCLQKQHNHFVPFLLSLCLHLFIRS